MEPTNPQPGPGQTVTPTPPAAPDTPAPQPAAPAPIPQPPAAPPPANPEPPVPGSAPAPETPVAPPLPEAPEQQPDAGQQFDPAPEEMPGTAADSGASTITWTASEFIAHAKSSGWYAALILVAVGAAAIIFLVTRDPISVVVVIVAALLFGIYANHKPRELQYQLDPGGLSIGQKHFAYDEFRSFAVLPEGAFSSIVFMPLKRFALPTTIYYAPEDEDEIVSLLGDRLPLDQRGHDAIDRLMHRVHF